jgi:hypothetical protein
MPSVLSASLGGGPQLCVPNMIQVLAEIKELGQGMVTDITLAA